MFAFAEAYLDKYAGLPVIVGERFPWVFIDEMQDTSSIQADLLDHLFSNSIVQRFGDINQAIFRHGEDDSDFQEVFPRSDAISLPQSKRFGQSIASFATNLTAVDHQNIQGNPEIREENHTIFLFDADSVFEVLPKFGELLRETYCVELPVEWPIKAIGYRKSPPKEEDLSKIPYDISDYWPNFQPHATSKSIRPNLLISFVREARKSLEQKCQWHFAHKLLVEGVIELLRRQKIKNEAGLLFTHTRLIETIGEEGFLTFRKLLLDWGMHQPLDEDFWKETLNILEEIMPFLAEQPLLPEAREFLKWVYTDTTQSVRAIDNRKENLVNVYQVESSNGSPINIEVTTIHSAKGETHLATLLLETYWYEHDLRELVPFLINQQDHQAFEKIRTIERAKRVFVGITRPRELLCLAMNKNHLTEDQVEALDESGWEIQDLTILEGNASERPQYSS